MSEPSTIAELLHGTMIGDTATIRNSQQKLQQLSAQPSFIPNLLLVGRQSTVPYNIQKSAVIYTKVLVRRYIQSSTSKDKLNELVDGLINFMGDQQAALSLRKYAAASIDFILVSDKENKIKNTLFANISPFLQKIVSNNQANVDHAFLGLYIQILLSSSPHVTRELIAFFRTAFLSFVQVNLILLNQIGKVIASQNRDAIIHSLDVLRIFSYSFKLFGRKFPVVDPETAKLLFEDSVFQLMNLSFDFQIKGNELKTSLFHYKINFDIELVEIFHFVKSDYIFGFKNMLRALIAQIRDPQFLSTNLLIKRPMLVPFLINSVEQLFSVMPYQKIKSYSLIRLIEEIYDTLLVLLKCNLYYTDFVEYKRPLLQNCLFKTLLMNENDFQNYFFMPEEFVNSLFQVIDKNPNSFVQARKNQNGYEQHQGDIESYDNLRTVAATLLGEVSVKVDGLLSQIFTFIFNVFYNKTETEFPKSLLLIMLGILRDQTVGRMDLHQKVIALLLDLVKTAKIPDKVFEPDDMSTDLKEETVQLGVILMILAKYINAQKKLSSVLIEVTFGITQKILKGEDVAQSLKLIAFDMVNTLSQFDEHQIGTKFISIFNELLQSDLEDVLVDKLLETVFQIYKLCEEELCRQLESTVRTIKNLTKIIIRQLQKNNCINRMMINKALNVMSYISDSDNFIPALMPQIEAALIELMPYSDEEKSSLNENIFMILVAFMKKTQYITTNQLTIFDIIPKLFYSSYKKKFDFSFEPLQLYIFYGHSIFCNTPQAIQTIIQMSIEAMNTVDVKGVGYNEANHCEGVLLLHSLIMGCGKAFNGQIWRGIMNSFLKRFENPAPKNNFLKANLLSGIALIITNAYHVFSNSENQVLLNMILQNYGCYSADYSLKLLVICLSEMLTLVNQEFIRNSLTFIIDSLIELLQVQKNNSFLFQTRKQNIEERDYENSIRMMKNGIMEMDELEHFKKKIRQLKEGNLQLLQEAVGQLPEIKKDFFREILSTIKVLNENRVFFKIKRQM